jgi:hypothetical protein
MQRQLSRVKNFSVANIESGKEVLFLFSLFLGGLLLGGFLSGRLFLDGLFQNTCR